MAKLVLITGRQSSALGAAATAVLDPWQAELQSYFPLLSNLSNFCPFHARRQMQTRFSVCKLLVIKWEAPCKGFV